MRWILIFLGSIAFINDAISQNNTCTYPATYISVDDGLSQSTVMAIVQDKQGFLWFATTDGLNRYDGNTFKVFKNDKDDSNSIPSNMLAPLALDSQGTIWIGAITGVAKYEKGSNTFSAVPLHSPFITDKIQTPQLLADRHGLLWVGTIRGLTTIPLDAKTPLPTGLNDTLNNEIHGERIVALYEDRKDNIWISAGKNLYRYDEKQSKLTIVVIPSPPATIVAIFEDSFGIMWFGTDDSRLLRFAPPQGEESRWSIYPIESENLKSPLGNFIYAITEDNVGHLWVGTRMVGLFQFDRTNHTWLRFIPPPVDQRFEGVTSLFVDRSGLVWVGYDGAGILKINPNPVKFHHLLLPKTSASSSGENFLKPVIADHLGRLWIGTYDQGLTMLNRMTNERIHFVHDPHNPLSIVNNSLLSLVEDLRGNIWIGTIAGIDRYNEKKKSFVHFSSMFSPTDSVVDGEVWAMGVDSSNTIWACTSVGLLKFDEGEQKFQTVLSTKSLKENWVTAVAIENDSSFWLGTAKTGVLHVNRTGAILEHFSTSTPNTLAFDFIKSLTYLSDGVLWCCTVSGLSRYDTKNKTWKSYRLKDGLPDETIYGILPSDDHTLWFSTNKGIVRMDVRDVTAPRFRNYTPEDGLQSYEFNTNTFCKSPSGEMFFGGINGLNAFYPDSVTDNPHLPPIVLTSFNKFDQPFNLGSATEMVKSISLHYSESVFSFEFAALEFTNPHRNSYSYFMEGYDRNWVMCGNRHEARYTNLDPGNYVFHVRGANNDGVWNEQGISIAITIVPPFWRTPWFFGATVLTLAGVFGGTVRYISVRKLRRKLDQLEQEKVIESHRKETREIIARDLHDEVSSTLSSMSLFVESSKLKLEANTQSADSVLTRLHDMAREAEDAMEQAVWSLSSNHQKLSHLLYRIQDVAVEQCQEHDINCRTHPFELNNDFVLSDIVRKNCFLIFRECLANVVKHSGARRMELLIEVTDQFFKLIITDDGTGFNTVIPSTKPRGGNGLKNMTKRADEIGASFDIQSEPGKGTTVMLTIEIAQMRY